MKKLMLLIGIFCVSLNFALAVDLTVTATAAVSPPGNNGMLLIEIDPSNAPPFSVTITGPGLNITQNISNFSLSKNNLSPGMYCVKVVMSQTGCEANACAEVMNCHVSGASYLCSIIADPCCRDVMFVGGNPSAYSSNGTPTNFTFEAHHALSEADFSLIADRVLNQSLATTAQIVQSGASPYDIESQNEYEGDDMFVYKFNLRGELLWAYHRQPKETQDRGEANFSAPGNGRIQVFPNPAADDIMLLFPANRYGSVALMDLNGRQISMNSLDAEASQMQLDVSSLTAGIYLLRFQSPGSESAYAKFVKHCN